MSSEAKRWHRALVALCFLLFGCASASSQATNSAPPSTLNPVSKPGIVAGILPFLPTAQIDDIYGPLVLALSESLGVPVQLRTATSFTAFSQALEAGEFDIALVQPFDYPALVDRGYQPIARVDLPLIASIVSIQDLGPRNSLIDVADLRIGTPPEVSAVHRLLDAEFDAAGVDHTTLDLRPFSTHADCLGQLQLGGVDVCAVATLPIRQFEAATNETLRVIAQTEPVNSIAFIAEPDLNPDLVRRIQTFLLGLDDAPQTQFLLDLAGIERYVRIADDDYEPMRELLAQAAHE